MRPALLAALLLAGCLAPGDAPPDAAAGLAFLPSVAVSDTLPGAEPVIARLPDGTLFVEGIGAVEGPPRQNVNEVYRSDDDGRTWTVVTPPFEGEARSNDGFVASGNGGSVYAANVFSLTFQLYRSDDKGATWTRLEVPRIPALMHRHWIVPVGASTVHVTVEALPPSFAPRLVGLPADGPATPNEGMWYVRSDDKGATWTTPVQIDPRVNFAGQGNMAVSADGARLYVLRYEEDRPVAEYTYADGRWYLLASEDGGATWERRDAFALTSELSTAVPPLVLDPAGTLYTAWSQEDGGASHVFYAASRDGGATWGAPVRLTDDGTHAMAWAAARGPGELGVMWYSADADGTASQVDAPWHIDFALVRGADAASPRVETVRVTPAAVHEGNICAKGPACGPGEDRTLLDYPWMLFGEDDGRARLVFPSTMWDRPSAFAVVAIQAPEP